MQSPRISVRIAPKVYEELSRIAVANRASVSDLTRELINEALIHRAESLTQSQFQHVEARLDYMEKRFSSFMVKIIMGVARGLYFSEQTFLTEATEEQKTFFHRKADAFAAEFLKTRGDRTMDVIEQTKEAS